MRSDPKIIKFCAQQVVKTKGIESRRALIKKLTEQYGSKGRVSFESDLKAEIDRIWIGRKG